MGRAVTAHQLAPARVAPHSGRSVTFHAGAEDLHLRARHLAVSEATSLGLLARSGILLPAVSEAAQHERRRASLSAVPTSLDLVSATVVDDASSAPRLTKLEVFLHLVKGNLGPGCLALPVVFAKVGPVQGSAILGLVAAGGIYSMLQLVHMKHALLRCGQSCHTFEDVGHLAFGLAGMRAVEVTVVLLQMGVTSVFFSLVLTNLTAGLGGVLPHSTCFLLVFAACSALSQLRHISALWPLSTLANVFMLCACLTAVVVSARVVIAGGMRLHPAPSFDVSASALCLSSLFFSFEGIALVLPIENAFSPPVKPAIPEAVSVDGDLPSHEHADPVRLPRDDRSAKCRRQFDLLLMGAMVTIAVIFLCVGATVSTAFPHITSGSVTAFFASTWPQNRWFAIVNALVTVAVLLTYPLQLQPAAMVVDKMVAARSARGYSSTLPVLSLARFALACVTALVVYCIPRLDLLIQLLGAMCQAALACLPFAISLRLHHLGLLPLRWYTVVLHSLLAAFCLIAMIVGTGSAVSAIVGFLHQGRS